MSNIQQSLNSILTTGAALKALGEKKELRKKEEEHRQLKIDSEKKVQEEQKRTNDFIDNFRINIKEMENKNTHFKLGLRSARELYRSVYDSLESFSNEYNNRTPNGEWR